jgi:hypothetical protein
VGARRIVAGREKSDARAEVRETRRDRGSVFPAHANLTRLTFRITVPEPDAPSVGHPWHLLPVRPHVNVLAAAPGALDLAQHITSTSPFRVFDGDRPRADSGSMGRDCASFREYVVPSRPLYEMSSLHRRGKNSSLKHVAVHLAQRSDVVRVLDALSHSRRSKSMRKINNALTPTIGLLVLGATIDQTSIDFQLSERNRSQPLDGRISAAEIIDRNADVIQLELHGHFPRQVWIANHLVLGQFDDQSGETLMIR